MLFHFTVDDEEGEGDKGEKVELEGVWVVDDGDDVERDGSGQQAQVEERNCGCHFFSIRFFTKKTYGEERGCCLAKSNG